MKYKLILFVILFGPFVYMASCNRNQKKTPLNDYKFPGKLSVFGIFDGDMASLVPAANVHLLELSSTLFTDYAEKQRLIKLPPGKKIKVNGDGLPQFPEGSILVKTFYYLKDKTQLNPVRQLIETRVLILRKGKWNAATYCWNADQTEAFYTPQGATVNANWKDNGGKLHQVAYHIPTHQECLSCHQQNDELLPIGPKTMNLNRTVSRDEKNVNQLDWLAQNGIVDLPTPCSKLRALPAYANPQEKLEKRARAYLEMNCAHCHNPAGLAYNKSVLFSYKVPFNHTGIAFNKRNIAERMETTGEFHMPKLGTTVLDKEGLQLIKDYLKTLKNEP